VPDLWSDLLTWLDLHPVPSGGTGAERSDEKVTEFEGRNQRLEYHRVFGGQLLGTALRPMDGVDQRGNGTAFTSAVTSHIIWFHRPFRTDGWLLLRQRSPLLAHGRSFGRGDMLAEDGTLVASYAQEALLRFAS
jgi:acyl-CoA thioesterase